MRGVSELPGHLLSPASALAFSPGLGRVLGCEKLRSWIGQQPRKQGTWGWPQVSSLQALGPKVDLTGQGRFCCLVPPTPC